MVGCGGCHSVSQNHLIFGLKIRSAKPTSLEDLRALLGNRLESLKGDRAGQFSIRVTKQWRICFEWPQDASAPSNVEIVDTH